MLNLKQITILMLMSIVAIGNAEGKVVETEECKRIYSGTEYEIQRAIEKAKKNGLVVECKDCMYEEIQEEEKPESWQALVIIAPKYKATCNCKCKKLGQIGISIPTPPSERSCGNAKYRTGNKCTACPRNAQCDGKKAICVKGYITKESTNGVVSCERKVCDKNQYLSGTGTCGACPANATCNGQTFTCATGFSKSGENCICSRSQWLNGNKCAACPTNATCNGKTFACKNGTEKKNDACVCKNSQWLNGTKCTKCPANATCNGETFMCKQGYSRSGSVCIKSKCKQSQWYYMNKCATCPPNATCDGATFTCKEGYNKGKAGTTCVKAN